MPLQRCHASLFLQPLPDLFSLGKAASMHDLPVDDDAGGRGDAVSRDRCIIGDFFNGDGDASLLGFRLHHFGSRIATAAAGAKDFHILHDIAPG